MKSRKVWIGLTIGSLIIATAVVGRIYSNGNSVVPAAGVTIPFEWVRNHIMFQVKVNNSRPLSFLLDTGNKYAIIELETAKELGLALGDEIKVKGGSAETSKGYFVKDASFTLPGYDGFLQDVRFALPLRHLAAAFGHDFDGILGSDFIQQFALEVDYENHRIILHDPDQFNYPANDQAIPIRLNHAGHLIVDAEVRLPAREPVKGPFVIDIGSGGPLLLNSPVVERRHLLDGSIKTVRAIGRLTSGGESIGQIGRTAELVIGSHTIQRPVTIFSQDKSGAHASESEMGNIGAQIMSRFNVLLDYSHDRIFLTPNASSADSFSCAFSGGLSLTAEGKDYGVIRVRDILENSPAADAGLRKDDIIESVDAKPVSDMTLTQLLDLFEKPITYTLRIRRGNQTLEVKLTPRKLV